MRPILNRQSALRAPLNDILGTEANVRLLRALAATAAPMSPSRLAEATGLHLSGVARALATLEETGIVEFVGAGSRRPVAFRRSHPLASAIDALFVAERARFDRIVEQLRDAARALVPPPAAVWLEGPVVDGSDRREDALVIGVLGTARDLDSVTLALQDALDDVVVEQDLNLEVRGRTLADLSAASPRELQSLACVIPLLGAPPLAIVRGGESRPATRARAVAERRMTHAELDAQGLAVARAIAERLKSDPSLVEQARAYVTSRLALASAAEQHELREWERILRTRSLPNLRRFLVDAGERATRLRQTMPFLAVLSAEEREGVVGAAREEASGVSAARRPRRAAADGRPSTRRR